MVKALNHTASCRKVIYPNLGFMEQLYFAEYDLYSANSLRIDQLDRLLQGELTDKPRPIARTNVRNGACTICHKRFFLYSKFLRNCCRYCNNAICIKCSTRLITNCGVELDEANVQEQESCPVCEKCLRILWTINLPSSAVNSVDANGAQKRRRRRRIRLKNSSAFDQIVTLNFTEGTDPKILLNVVRKRFAIDGRKLDHIELLLPDGSLLALDEPFSDGVLVHVSLGSSE